MPGVILLERVLLFGVVAAAASAVALITGMPIIPPPHDRFLLPALQLCIPVCGAGLFQLLLERPRKPERSGSGSSKHQHEGHSSGGGGSRASSSSPEKDDRLRWRRAAALVCLALQVPAAIYLSTVHQRGPVAVMDVLASHAKALIGSSPSSATTAPMMTVLFLMPCHSTPFHSHVHSASVSMAFLDCSPPGMEGAVRRLNCPGHHHHKGEDDDEEGEEAIFAAAAPDDADGGDAAHPSSWECSLPALSVAAFAADPDGTAARLLSRGTRSGNWSPGAAPPSHVVVFGAAAEALDPVLRGFGYLGSERVFNTHVALDEAQAGDTIVVYTRHQESLSSGEGADAVHTRVSAAERIKTSN